MGLEERVECLEDLIAQLKQQHKDYIKNLIREQEVTLNEFSLNLENRHLDDILEGIIDLVRNDLFCFCAVKYYYHVLLIHVYSSVLFWLS